MYKLSQKGYFFSKKPYLLIGNVLGQLDTSTLILASSALLVIFSFIIDFVSLSFSQFLRDFCLLISK